MHELSKSIKQTKHNMLIFYIAFFWLLIFILSNLNTRDRLYSFYNLSDFSSWDITNLPSNIQYQLNKIISYKYLQEEDYTNAINTIKWQDAESYYDLWTIKTLQAYNDALSSNLSWLQRARYLITEAIKDFDTASQIQLNNSLDKYISNNLVVSEKLWVIIKVKTCYSEHQNTIDSLSSFNDQLDKLKWLLELEAKLIADNKNLDSECKKNLEDINKASLSQLGLLQSWIQQYNKDYKNKFAQFISQPEWCLDNIFVDIWPTIQEADDSIQEFANTHQNSITALSSSQWSKELCNQAKDDSQINEKIENSLNKLMQQLEDNLNKQKQSWWEEKEEEKWKDEENPEYNNNQVQYKNVLQEDELHLLEQVNNNNKSLIKQIMDTKWKLKYQTNKLLNELFSEFYGNSWDFQNLTPKTEINSNKR